MAKAASLKRGTSTPSTRVVSSSSATALNTWPIQLRRMYWLSSAAMTHSNSVSSMKASLDRPVSGMAEIPISPPSASCCRTTPTNRKPTPMVVMARKSARTRRLASPTITPKSAGTSMASGNVSRNGMPALHSSAEV